MVAAGLLVIGGCSAESAVPPPSREPPSGSVRLGVFEGKVPCSDCNKVKVRLTLHRDAQTLAPTSYVLERINVGNDDARLITEGTWTTAVGSPVDERLAVAVLATAPPGFTRYLMLGANLLLVLDDKLEPRVGNALYSFTLSRTE